MATPVVWPRIQAYQQNIWSPIATYMGVPPAGVPTQTLTPQYPSGPAYPLNEGATTNVDGGLYNHNFSSSCTDANGKVWVATSVGNATGVTGTLVNPLTSVTYTYGPVPLL